MQAGNVSPGKRLAEVGGSSSAHICGIALNANQTAGSDRGEVMKVSSIPTVLLLANPHVSPHVLRVWLRRAGLTMLVEQAGSREVAVRRIADRRPDLVLCGIRGLPDAPLKDILKKAGEVGNGVPVIVLAGEQSGEPNVWALSSNIAGFVRAPHYNHLPPVIDRILRGSQRRVSEGEMRGQLERASEVLRDNQKMATIGRLAASIAHEINNPLESVTNLLFLIGEARLPENVRGYLELAQRELGRAALISRQTLNFSRETTSPVHVQMADLVEEVLVLYAQKITNKHIKIVRNFETDRQATVFPGEMRQVLSNLITNAIDASEQGGRLQVRIRAARKWSDPRVIGLRVTIADNGSGIPPAVRHRLGQPFFTTKGQRGTGLGLWVTQSIVERYGGSLQLRSSVSPGCHGTVFAVFLPTNLRPQAVTPIVPNPEGGGDMARETGQRPWHNRKSS